MPYVDLAGLSRFAGKSKDFASSACAGPDMANWQRTAAAGAVSFAPVPEMPLDPVVNFAFTETGPASGTKGPDNPSTITGVSSVKVTRCGKNLCPDVGSADWMYDRGVNVVYTADGGCKLTGTAASNATPFLYFLTNGNLGKWPKVIQYGKTYTFSLVCNDSNVYLEVYDSNSTTAWGSATTVAAGGHATKTITGGASFICRLCVARGATVDTTAYIQIEEGTSATSFEPYEGADYAVNLGGTFYGGSVDLSTGVMTVTQFGEEFGVIPSSRVFVGSLQTNTVAFDIICENRNKGNTSQGIHISNRFEFAQNNNDNEHFRATGNTSTGSLSLRFFINKSRLDLSSAADQSNPTDSEWIQAFLAWLTNNHIFVVCDLFSPQTVSLTSLQIYSLSQPDPYTPRLNTVYSDQVSVQVGYPKSPQASQTELTNAIVSLGGNV